MAATRDYEYVVYPEVGPPTAIYSVSKGRFVGYIHPNGKFVRFGRAY